MDTIQAAQNVIRDAEAALRDLISKALSEQRYGDVKQIADLADRVSQLLSSNGIHLSVAAAPSRAIETSATEGGAIARPPPAESRKIGAPPKRHKAAAKTNRRTRAMSGYPKFVRDEDRLVKIGWSKKNSREYEHRVPREAVLAFLHHLDGNVDEAKVFDIEGLLPVQDDAGEDIPGYQIYVVIAWLREAGVIEKKGRDGYVIRDKSVLSGELNDLWESLRARSA